MINLPAGTRILLVAWITDLRNGYNGLAAKVQTTLKDNALSGHVFILRGRNGSSARPDLCGGSNFCPTANIAWAHLLKPSSFGWLLPFSWCIAKAGRLVAEKW
ncbi:IS66 Orf2 like protein [Serratia fonticola]|uniref:IS66 family insertion sequence element accessory protein TnpB n=1 Tax=Serratia fonticola TaxID=47917 RepID=UPI002183489C|nr:IS66 Orf2 like protein [Serratia fonticola]